MKYLIIPDVHNKTEVADQILGIGKDAGCKKTIFTGDFFDSFGDDDFIAKQTAEWLKAHLHDEDKIFIHGNHDTSYQYSNHYHFVQCSGFSRRKSVAISSVLDKADWARFNAFYRVDKFFFTHAGISRDLIQLLVNRGEIEEDCTESPDKLDLALTMAVDSARKIIDRIRAPELYDVSYMRGGNAEVGGITWCDLSEFRAVKGIYQVFGHTPLKQPCVVKLLSDREYHYPTMTLYDRDAKLIDNAERDKLAAEGCGIGIDTHLEGYAILDTEQKKLEVWKCAFNREHQSDVDFTRKITKTTKAWEFNYEN